MSNSTFTINNNQKVFSFLKDKKLTDVTLTADGNMLRAHKVTLAANSKYFEVSKTSDRWWNIFASFCTKWKIKRADFNNFFRQNLFVLLGEEKYPVVVLKDVRIKYLLLILEYIYCGQIELPPDDIEEFKKLAESLEINVGASLQEKVGADVPDPEPLPHMMSQDLQANVSSTIDDSMSFGSDETMGHVIPPSSTRQTLSIKSVKSLCTEEREPTAGKQPLRSVRAKSDAATRLAFLNSTVKCVYCDGKIREKDRNYHHKFCWKNPNRVQSNCKECKKKFDVPSKLRQHISRSHPKKNY